MYLPNYFLAYLPIYLPTQLFTTHMWTYIHTYLHTCLPTYALAYLPKYLPTYLFQTFLDWQLLPWIPTKKCEWWSKKKLTPTLDVLVNRYRCFLNFAPQRFQNFQVQWKWKQGSHSIDQGVWILKLVPKDWTRKVGVHWKVRSWLHWWFEYPKRLFDKQKIT
jgi:hypothetical protein